MAVILLWLWQTPLETLYLRTNIGAADILLIIFLVLCSTNIFIFNNKSNRDAVQNQNCIGQIIDKWGSYCVWKWKGSDSNFKFASDNPEFAQLSPFSCPLCGIHHPSNSNTVRVQYCTCVIYHIIEHLQSISLCWTVSDWVLCQVCKWPGLYHGLNLYIVWGDVLYVCLLYGQVGFLYKCCTHTFNSVNVNNKTEAVAWLMFFSVLTARRGINLLETVFADVIEMKIKRSATCNCMMTSGCIEGWEEGLW